MHNDTDNLTDHQMRVDTERALEQIFELLGQVTTLRNAVHTTDHGEAQVMAALVSQNRQHHGIAAPLISNDIERTQAMQGELSTKLNEIDDKIPADFAEKFPIDFSLGNNQSFCFGTVQKILERKPILRGFAEVVKSEAIGSILTQKLAFFLMTIPGLKDKLCRENHDHFGYHYHYLDKDERRSDTILTFGNPLAIANEVTLFFEPHAVKKAGFAAKMDTWGDKKRVSTYETCVPDLKKWPLSEFKRPSKHAATLWQIRSAP